MADGGGSVDPLQLQQQHQSSSGGGGSAGALVGGIISWDSEIGSVKSNIHVVHSGGRSYLTASTLTLFAILSAARNDAVAWYAALLHNRFR